MAGVPRGQAQMSDSPLVPVPAELRRFVLLPDRVVVVAAEQEIQLTITQFRILTVLDSEPGRVFSRADLVKRGIGEAVSERTVEVHIKEIRRKLGNYAELIETVRHAGYRLRR